MNSGLVGFPVANPGKVFSQTIIPSMPAANSVQTLVITPQVGYSEHSLTIPYKSGNSSTINIILSSGFSEGYQITLLHESSSVLLVNVYDSDGSSLLYTSPHVNNATITDTIIFIFIAGVWKRRRIERGTNLGNNNVAQLINFGTYHPIILSSGGSGLSGTQGSLSSLGSSCYANGATTGSYGWRRDYGILARPGGGRTVTNPCFTFPWACTFVCAPYQYQVTGVGAMIRLGIYGAAQNCANDGTPGAAAMGVQFDPTGLWSIFYHNGSSLTVTPTSITSDVGGGQGGNVQSWTMYYDPLGILEWYYQNSLVTRLTNITISVGLNYTIFNMAAGVTTGTVGSGNPSCSFFYGVFYRP